MLNESQKKAFQMIKIFLLNPSEKYFTITSPGGYGKSYLLNYMEEQWNTLNNQRQFLQMDKLEGIKFGCSTNKAASILNNSETVHKLFGLIPHKNFKTGKTHTVKTTKSKDVGSSLIIIDEASMLDETMLRHIDELTTVAKVIFVGDEHQLAPVGSSTVPVFSQGYTGASLTEPMRQDKESHLFKEITKLREAVIEQYPYQVKAGEGITFLNGSAFKQEIVSSFKNQEDSRVLAYTNNQVEGYNGYVRKQLHGVTDFKEGDLVVAANCCNERTKIEQTYRITAINNNNNEVTLDDGYTYKVPVNKLLWFKEIKVAEREAKQDGNWAPYFALKEDFLDVRDGFSCTVNKSQGSSYKKVFLDLQNINTCRNLNTLLRLLYVAHSRGSEEIIIYKG